MPNMDYYNHVILPIMQGNYDDYLDNFIQACQNRKKDVAPKIWEFQVGDRVRMVNCNPKYLNGQYATVKKINRTKVVVDLDCQEGRFYKNITTPLSMVEKV